MLEALGLPLWHEALLRPGPDGRREVLRGLEEFREHLGGELTLTLLRAIGQGIEVGDVREDAFERALEWLRSRARTRAAGA